MAEDGGGARRSRRRRLRLLAALPLCYGAATLLGMPVSLPFDFAVGAWPAAVHETLMAPQDGATRLVVLQHGLLRSPWALWRLERALQAHGYETLNPGYPSTAITVQAAADRLQAALSERLAGRPGTKVAFVGHSLGGLVIQELLRREGAPAPFACVYLAVPHRGAVLADLRKGWWPFPWVMGDQAAFQLSPGDPLHALPILWLERSGVVVGDKGPANPSIPGRDDGTVAVVEARLEGACDEVVLPLGHTTIAFADEALRQTLCFLRRLRFAREPAGVGAAGR